MISLANNLYSLPLHFKSRRHVSILSPHVVSVSPAHFAKSLPHFAIMHLRSPISHAFWFDDIAARAVFVAVVVAADAFSDSRCFRIILAKSSSDISFDADAPPIASSNMDVRSSNSNVSSTISSGSSMVSVSGSVTAATSVDCVDATGMRARAVAGRFATDAAWIVPTYITEHIATKIDAMCEYFFLNCFFVSVI